MLAGFVVVAIQAAVGIASSLALILSGGLSAAFEQNPGLPPGFPAEGFVRGLEISTLVFAVLGPFMTWVLVSLTMQLVTRFFGGTGPLSAMFAVVGVAGIVSLIGSLLTTPVSVAQLSVDPTSTLATVLSLLGSALGLAFFLWYAALVVVGARFARNIGYGEATGSCAISCAGCLGLIIIVGVVIGVGFAFLIAPSLAPPQ